MSWASHRCSAPVRGLNAEQSRAVIEQGALDPGGVTKELTERVLSKPGKGEDTAIDKEMAKTVAKKFEAINESGAKADFDATCVFVPVGHFGSTLNRQRQAPCFQPVLRRGAHA